MSGSILTMTHFVELVKALAWPFVVLIIVFLFRAQFKELFERASELNFKAPGVSFELTIRQVHDVAQELFREVSEGLKALDEDQRKLFWVVSDSNGSKTVEQLTQEVFATPFRKDSVEHDQFRSLSDVQLIRPKEGGRWKADRHPVVTPYAQIILKAAPGILAPAKPTSN